jgi:hypothetical protein
MTGSNGYGQAEDEEDELEIELTGKRNNAHYYYRGRIQLRSEDDRA